MTNSASDGLPPARRYLALLVVVVAIWAVMIDAVAVSWPLRLPLHWLVASRIGCRPDRWRLPAW